MYPAVVVLVIFVAKLFDDVRVFVGTGICLCVVVMLGGVCVSV